MVGLEGLVLQKTGFQSIGHSLGREEVFLERLVCRGTQKFLLGILQFWLEEWNWESPLLAVLEIGRSIGHHLFIF